MKLSFSLILLLLASASLFGLDWSRNHVYKFTAPLLQNFETVADYQNLEVMPEFIQPTVSSNSWLSTYPLDIGNDFVVSEAFVNFQSENTNSYIFLQLRNCRDDRILSEKQLFHSGKMDLINIFDKRVYLNLEAVGQDLKIYSFGLVKKTEVVMTESDAIIIPDILFFDEASLTVQFYLHFPAYLDIILFDPKGNIIDYLTKKQFFKEGQNFLDWEPEDSKSEFLKSGPLYVYFRVRSLDGKELEINKNILFVKK